MVLEESEPKYFNTIDLSRHQQWTSTTLFV